MAVSLRHVNLLTLIYSYTHKQQKQHLYNREKCKLNRVCR